MSLALIIPVRDDQAKLTRLLAQAREMALFSQIIVVDDGSEHPAEVSSGIDLLRHPASRGAGAARNTAVAQVRCDHMMFFDSDDLFTPEFAPLWAEAQSEAFDFCIFRHQDSALRAQGFWGQLPADTGLWNMAGCLSSPLKRLGSDGWWHLAETSNYPWNKIYRTAFFRDQALRCSETRVHNDIELHWRSFLTAKTVLTSNRIAALHVTTAEGGRITNVKSKARLELFVALEALKEAFSTWPEASAARCAFLRFCSNLFIWAEATVTADIRPALRAHAAGFIRENLPKALFRALAETDPKTALQLCLQMRSADLPEGLPC